MLPFSFIVIDCNFFCAAPTLDTLDSRRIFQPFWALIHQLTISFHRFQRMTTNFDGTHPKLAITSNKIFSSSPRYDRICLLGLMDLGASILTLATALMTNFNFNMCKCSIKCIKIPFPALLLLFGSGRAGLATIPFWASKFYYQRPCRSTCPFPNQSVSKSHQQFAHLVHWLIAIIFYAFSELDFDLCLFMVFSPMRNSQFKVVKEGGYCSQLVMKSACVRVRELYFEKYYVLRLFRS